MNGFRPSLTSSSSRTSSSAERPRRPLRRRRKAPREGGSQEARGQEAGKPRSRQPRSRQPRSRQPRSPRPRSPWPRSRQPRKQHQEGRCQQAAAKKAAAKKPAAKKPAAKKAAPKRLRTKEKNKQTPEPWLTKRRRPQPRTAANRKANDWASRYGGQVAIAGNISSPARHPAPPRQQRRHRQGPHPVRPHGWRREFRRRRGNKATCPSSRRPKPDSHKEPELGTLPVP